VGTAADFMGFTPEGSAYVEPKMALRTRLKGLRMQKHLSRVELAKRLGSSQPRVGRIQTGDSPVERRGTGVAFDGLVRGL
jgi:hypothetical protein